jgi:hypothetical protein
MMKHDAYDLFFVFLMVAILATQDALEGVPAGSERLRPFVIWYRVRNLVGRRATAIQANQCNSTTSLS